MENKLDKFIQQKIEQRTFEFNPEHWEGAAQMLDVQDKRDDWWKKGVFLLGGILLLAGLLYGWGQFGATSLSTNNMLNENDVQQSMLPSASSSTFANEQKTTPSSETTERSTSKNLKQQKNTNIGTDQDLATSAKSSIEKTEQTTTRTTKTNLQKIAEKKLQETTTQTNNQQHKSSNDRIPTSSLPIYSEDEQVVHTLEKKSSSNNNAFESDKGNVQVPAMETITLPVDETTNKRSQQTKGNEQAAIGKEDAMQPTFSVVEQLPTITRSEVQSPDQKENVDDLNLIKPLNKTGFKRVQVGLQVSSLLYPANADEKSFIGYALGITAQYRITRKLSINTDLLYQKRTGTFTDTDMTSQTIYRFGFEKSETVFKASSLHYLEVPIYVQLKHKAHLLDLGYAYNYLLGTKGTITERSSSTLNPEPVDGNSSTDWFESTIFNQNFSTAFIGYRFQFGRKFQVGIRAHYNLSPIMSEDGELDRKLLEADKLHFRALLQYTF